MRKIEKFSVDNYKFCIYRIIDKDIIHIDNKYIDGAKTYNRPNAPRYDEGEQYRTSMYKAISIWAHKNGIVCAAGPVLSGALISYGISISSFGKIKHSFLPKPDNAYNTLKHDSYVEINSEEKTLLVDDVISSGEALFHSISFLELHLCNIAAILCFRLYSNKFIINRIMKNNNYKDKLFGIAYRRLRWEVYILMKVIYGHTKSAG